MSRTTRSILKFILKTLAVAFPVPALALGWYIFADPFKVLRHYDTYFPEPMENPLRVGVNKGMVTVNNFEDRIKEGHRYNAFIFGSSVSCVYDAKTWALMADSSGSASPYHFDSSGESLPAMADKVEYLDREGHELKYALVVLDPIVMAGIDDGGPATIAPPQLRSAPTGWLRFHYTFFRAATNADFFKSWLPAQFSGKPETNGRNLVFEEQPIVYDPLTNQETIPLWDSLIAHSPNEFYARYPLPASPDKAVASPPLLTGKRLAALQRVQRVFESHRTDCHIIIAPNRRQVTLNQADLDAMRRLFGTDRVHDFSVSMVHELEQDTLLYDDTHYRPSFALRLMRRVYKKPGPIEGV